MTKWFSLTRTRHNGCCIIDVLDRKEEAVSSVTNGKTTGSKSASGAPRRERRSKTTPKPKTAEIAAEAASIYPDTFNTPPTPEEIAAEAYAIYQSRGGAHGGHENDWLEAERRLRERREQK